jgi:transposase
MAYKLDPMDLKQILSLHLDGYSNRKIGRTLGLSRNTINGYLKLFMSCEIPITELINKTEQELRELFPSHSTINNSRFEALMSYFEKVNLARNKPGFTFLYHYQEYAHSVSEPYSYTQFMEHYHRKHAKQRGSMKLEHVAGNELYIDFAGKKLEIVDASTGEVSPVEVFIAILPCSQYTYVEACFSQKKEDLIRCTENALRFFGGVPKAIVSDNLKSAVSRSSKYEADINRSFKDFARHYSCVINPTRAYAPQDKALVENAVQLTYQRIYYPIREMAFFSLAELNKEIRRLLESYNDLLFSRKEASRKELFQSIERDQLKPLPAEKYELKGYKRAKVQKIGYVYFSVDKTYYSVPYRYIGKETQIQFTQSKVEIYYNNERIASHDRNPSKGIYITNKDHLSSCHKAYSEWSPSYFISKAEKHGSSVVALINGLINQGDYPEVQYKRAMGIIQLHKQYGSERLNNACGIALQANTYSYNRIKNMLENNMDKLGNPDDSICSNQTSHIPKHQNIRGAKSYQ